MTFTKLSLFILSHNKPPDALCR